MSSPAGSANTPPQLTSGTRLPMLADDEVGELVRRLRRRQRLSRLRLSNRVLQISGDQAMNPDRLRQWEVGRQVPDGYWRGWLAMALSVPRGMLDRAALVTDGRRRTQRRVRAGGRSRPAPSHSRRAGQPWRPG
jgi:hypothetical protein